MAGRPSNSDRISVISERVDGIEGKIQENASKIDQVLNSIGNLAKVVQENKPDTSDLEQGLAALGARLDESERRRAEEAEAQAQAKAGPKTLAEGLDEKTVVVNRAGFNEMTTDQYFDKGKAHGDLLPRGPVHMDGEGNSLDPNWRHEGDFWVQYDPKRIDKDTGEPVPVRKIPYYTPKSKTKPGKIWDTGFEPRKPEDYMRQQHQDVRGTTRVEGPSPVPDEYEEEAAFDARLAEMKG